MAAVTLITPTGGRPEAFRLCEHFIRRQTYQDPLQWIVVDDCDPPTPTSLGQTVIRPEPRWRPWENTLSRNLLAALPLVEGENVLIIEDDDWYAPDYIELMLRRLSFMRLVGESTTRYYHITERAYLINPNREHSSLCQTGLRREELPALQAVLESHPRFIDVEFYRRMRVPLYPCSGSLLGIKGLPGRPGIGSGHRVNTNFTSDPDLLMLRAWIGEDAELYREFMEPNTDTRFTIFISSGQKRFGCARCPFDTYDELMFDQHWTEMHQPKATPMPTLFDSQGQQIMRAHVRSNRS